MATGFKSLFIRIIFPARYIITKSSFFMKKIQYSLLNNIDKEDKTSAYFQAKNIELEGALNKALSLATPNRFKLEAQILFSMTYIIYN
jgi:hypothetical protein